MKLPHSPFTIAKPGISCKPTTIECPKWNPSAFLWAILVTPLTYPINLYWNYQTIVFWAPELKIQVNNFPLKYSERYSTIFRRSQKCRYKIRALLPLNSPKTKVSTFDINLKICHSKAAQIKSLPQPDQFRPENTISTHFNEILT